MSLRPRPAGTAAPVDVTDATDRLSHVLLAGLTHHGVAPVDAPQDKAKPSKKAPAWSFGFPKGPSPYKEQAEARAKALAEVQEDNRQCRDEAAMLRKRALDRTADVARLQTELNETKADLEKAKSDFSKWSKKAVEMMQNKNVAEAELESVRTGFNDAQAALAQAQRHRHPSRRHRHQNRPRRHRHRRCHPAPAARKGAWTVSNKPNFPRQLPLRSLT